MKILLIRLIIKFKIVKKTLLKDCDYIKFIQSMIRRIMLILVIYLGSICNFVIYSMEVETIAGCLNIIDDGLVEGVNTIAILESIQKYLVEREESEFIEDMLIPSIKSARSKKFNDKKLLSIS